MKKVVGFSVALAAVLFAACDNKENSYNFAQIIYPSGYGSVLYADLLMIGLFRCRKVGFMWTRIPCPVPFPKDILW